MKHPVSPGNRKRTLRLKGKNAHKKKVGYGTKNNPSSSTQKLREEIEPEGEQARFKKAKGK